jgi:hypothetical protein
MLVILKKGALGEPKNRPREGGTSEKERETFMMKPTPCKNIV